MCWNCFKRRRYLVPLRPVMRVSFIFGNKVSQLIRNPFLETHSSSCNCVCCCFMNRQSRLFHIFQFTNLGCVCRIYFANTNTIFLGFVFYEGIHFIICELADFTVRFLVPIQGIRLYVLNTLYDNRFSYIQGELKHILQCL